MADLDVVATVRYHQAGMTTARALATVATHLRAGCEMPADEQVQTTADDRYRQLFESLDQGVIYQDADGVIFDANPAAARLLGRPAERLLGRGPAQFHGRLMRPDGSPLPADDIPAMVVLRSGEEVRGTVLGVRMPRGGDVRWLRVDARPLGQTGGPAPFQVYSVLVDVTEQRRAEAEAEQARAAAAAAEYQLRDVLMQAPAGVTLVEGPEFRVTLINPIAKRLIGGRVVTGQTLREAMPELVERGVIERYERVYATGETHIDTDMPVSFVQGDGQPQERVFTFIYQPVRSTAGAITGVITLAIDVTTTYRARLGLELSENRYRSLVAATTSLVWNTDPQGMVVDMPGWRAITGQTVDEVRGRGWLDALHPDDQERVAEIWDLAFATRGKYQVTYSIRSESGGWRTMDVRGAPIVDERGTLLEWIGTATDVTEQAQLEADREQARQEAEAARRHLEDLFLNAPAMIAVMREPAHRFELVNDLFCRLVGREPGALLGRTVREALPEVVEQGFIDLLDRVYRGGEAFLGREVQLKLDLSGTGKLEERYFTFVYQPSHDHTGAVDGILLHAVDVTDQVLARRAAEGLAEVNARLYREAQTALRVRDEFLGSVSHDLRTPLGAIKGFAQLLQRQAALDESLPRDRVEPLLQGIGAAADKMTSMIEELLDVTRLEAGRPLDLNREPLDLVALVQGLARDYQRAAPAHEISVRSAVDQLVGPWDRDRLERVVGNLLSNAVKYSPAGGLVTVIVEREQERGDWAVVRVQDSGVGIPAAELPRVFERFFRASNVRSSVRGIGIGLAGSKAIAEQHGGTLDVLSEEGAGTTVVLRLPLDAPAPKGEGVAA